MFLSYIVRLCVIRAKGRSTLMVFLLTPAFLGNAAIPSAVGTSLRVYYVSRISMGDERHPEFRTVLIHALPIIQHRARLQPFELVITV